MKTVGIAVDNWKIERFKKELADKGYTDLEITPMVDKTSLIKFDVEDTEVHEIHRLCERLQLELRHRN